MNHNYKIYQLDAHDDNVIRDHKLFEPWEMLNRTAGFNFHQYKLVWEDTIEMPMSVSKEEVLDTLFGKFNLHHPENYHGRSMSVSDVVELDGVKYYCDSFGWVKI